ncbi:rod shape-determining protein RodA [Metabacillus arenae]|uniref:Rod shape-determining protein RodA n=1 Tax=Metabacillus arenae TaxID=2771434 RepID=A0A926NHE2_9BACI|nr:rod shape-determining protein RodA [Metabacillus arenae]MBD1381326.1 rod shape-determining protein RodA [Metabacillus arenae]
MDKENQSFYSRFDYQLAFLLFLLFCASMVAIYAAQSTSGQYEGGNYLIRQIVWYIVGGIIVAIVMYFDSEQLQRVTWYLYGFGLFLLGLLVILPESIVPTINGARSWFQIPGLSLQPSEFVKVFVILALSQIITTHHQKYLNKSLQTDFILLVKMGITAVVPIMFIMKQPDLGTSLVILAILAGMTFVSGISWKIITFISLSITLVGTTVLYLVIQAPEFLNEYLGIKQYQLGRIYSWLNPEVYKSGEGYHLLNSLKAIGSGQVFGKGLGTGDVYIPENHTDFIFSVIGEQFGFIGTSIVLSIFFLLVYHLVKVAMETTESFNSYLCAGVISMIVFHVFQNAGMTIGLLPITGIPLPFISYGGSSMMGSMFAIGLIFGIRYHHRVYMFSND